MRPILLFLAVPLFAQPYRVVIQTGVPVKMRDGVTLRADVFRPDDPGKFPVLLERTPYNRAGDTHGFRTRRARLRRGDSGYARALCVGR